MGRSWSAKWVAPKKEDTFHPIIYRDFFINDEFEKATLFISGVGLFEVFINGIKVGNEYLTPYFSDYSQYIQYFEYDITNYLNNGVDSDPNSIDISLGNGWYKGRFGLEGKSENFGDRFAAIAEIVIEKKNTKELVVTDESWSYYGSDIEDSGIYDGEIFNRLLWEHKDNGARKVEIINLDQELIPRYSIPVVVKEELKVKEVINTPKGEIVLDFGQNFAGYVQFVSNLPRGAKITLEFAEVLQDGNFYNENYRSAKGGFTYVSDGVSEVVAPRFTYFGGRYVKVSGWVGELNPDDFTGCVVYSDMERTGFIETSNEKLNRLYENCLWSQKSNFIDIPTDCPQRDERLGWTGDIQIFANTAAYNMDVKDFLLKDLFEIRNEQIKLNGAVPAFIPSGGGAPISSGWGDVATFVPTVLYKMYGDIKIIEECYDMMKDWVDYIDREDSKRENKHYLFDFGFHFGDWVSLDGVTENSYKGSTDDFYVSSAYYYMSAKMVSEAAGVLGNIPDMIKYKQLSENIKAAFLDEYFTKTGRLSIDTQTAYILALRFGLYIDKDRVINSFKNRLKKDGYKIKAGFAGGPVICQVLAENGLAELAYKLLLNEDYPGWINEVNLGATTIWERWNTVDSHGNINPNEMNSCNHFAYGSIAEFMYAYMGGIKPLEPGFELIEIKPIINHRITSFRCSYKSVKGTIVSNWDINEDGTLNFHIEIPEGAKAKVYLPSAEDENIDEEICVEAGVYNYEYKPEYNYKLKFNSESTIEDYLQDEKAREIIKSICPELYSRLENADIETLSETLDFFEYSFFEPGTPEEIQKIKEKLWVLV